MPGDFNVIQCPSKARKLLDYRAMQNISDWIDHHGMIDFPLAGVQFTW